MHEKIENRKETLLQKHLTLQPFIVLLEEVDKTTTYVVVNDVLYLCESPLRGLDVCFKIFFALDCKYPAECQQIWTFIQSFVYKIEPEKRFAGLNVIVNEINNIIAKSNTQQH